MTSKLKALGLALVAVFAMSALVASAAQAVPQVTSQSSPLRLEGTGGGSTEALTSFGSTVSCTTIHYKSSLTATPSSTITLEMSYEGCTGFGGLLITVTMNGCTYVFHLTEKVAAGHYRAHVDIVCPAGKEIEIHVYGSAAAHTAGTALCTVKIPPQNNLTTVDIRTTTTAGQNFGDIDVFGTISNIKMTQIRNSFLCPAGTETTAAQLDIRSEANPVTIIGNRDFDISGE